MVEDGVFAEADELHARQMLIRHLRQRERRLKRMSQFLAVTLLLVLLAALLLVVLLYGNKEAGSQHMAQNGKQSSDEDNYASARLTAPDVYNPQADYLEWQSDKGEVHCRGFTYSNGSLVVPAHVWSGTYRISLQVTYEGSFNNPSTNEAVKILGHQVLVVSDSYRIHRPILSSEDTVSSHTKHWKKTLYTEGLFKLEASSRISVTSRDPNLVVRKEYLTFFSAELLKVHAD